MVRYTSSSFRSLALFAIFSALTSRAVALTPQEEEESKNAWLRANEDVEAMRNAWEGENVDSGNDTNQNFLRGSGKTPEDLEPATKGKTTIETVLCSDEQFSSLCKVFSDVKSNNTLSGRTGTFVEFDIDYLDQFTLFAPTNTAFTQPIIGVLPERLSISDFLNTHIINRRITFEELSFACFYPLETRFSGETTTTYCDLSRTPQFQKGEGNVPSDMPRFIGRLVNLPAGRGIIHAIDNFIKPSQFLDTPSPSQSQSPSMTPSETPSNAPSRPTDTSASPSTSVRPSSAPSISLFPSAKPSDAPSRMPSVAPSQMPSGMPSQTPSSMPTNPTQSPSQSPTASPTAATTVATSETGTDTSTSGSSASTTAQSSDNAMIDDINNSNSTELLQVRHGFGGRVGAMARRSDEEPERKPRTIFGGRNP